MAAAASQKSVAQQLRKLAADPSNQVHIVKEKGCMKGLRGFLDSSDPEVVTISLQALQFLSSHPANRAPLAKYPTLLVKLALLVDHENEQVSKVAHAVLTALDAKEADGSDVTHSRASVSTDSAGDERKTGVEYTPKTLHGVAFPLPQMQTQAMADRVETALLAVKGVVSVTIDLGGRSATVYTRAAEEELRPAIASALLRVGMVIGKAPSAAAPARAAPVGYPSAPPKVAYPQPSAAAASTVTENGSSEGNASAGTSADGGKPSYLTPATKRAYKKGALVEYSTLKQSTLEARQEEERKKKEEEEKKQSSVRSLFGTVAGYFW